MGIVAYEAKTAEQPQAHYGYDPHLSPQLVWAGKPGRVSLPFQPGKHRRIAVKVIDQRGNEVMRVVGIPT